MKKILVITFLLHCIQTYCQTDSISMEVSYSKNKIPESIYNYLDIKSINDIADPNGDWSAGCTPINNWPRRKFHWMAMDKNGNIAVLISTGGIGVYTNCYVINWDKGIARKYNGIELNGKLDYKEVYKLIKEDKLEFDQLK